MYFKTACLSITVTLLSVVQSVSGNLIMNGGFETGSPQLNIPNAYGYWSGDITTVVGGSDGIIPYEGNCMLKFLDASPAGPGIATIGCQVFQVVNINPGLDDIRSGTAVVYASAFLNRIAGDDQTDTAFSILIYAFQGSTSSISPEYIATDDYYIAKEERTLLSDADVDSWEKLDISFQIPSETDYLIFELRPYENIFNDADGTEFDGHYADAVSLMIIPEPCTVFFLALGGILARRK